MKRKEAVKHISNFFKVAGVKTNYCDTENQHDILADEIISLIMKIGMLAPKHTVDIFTRKPDKYGGAELYGWEPEDD